MSIFLCVYVCVYICMYCIYTYIMLGVCPIGNAIMEVLDTVFYFG